jgi:hypothetical protein
MAKIGLHRYMTPHGDSWEEALPQRTDWNWLASYCINASSIFSEKYFLFKNQLKYILPKEGFLITLFLKYFLGCL